MSKNEALTSAARQLLEIEELFGGVFAPAQRNPLPELVTSRAPAMPHLDPKDKAQGLADIAEEVSTCVACGLCQGRHHTVPGEGDPDADLVFVGEGPGQDEDLSGKPFVGRAGQLLGKMIGAMGLTRDDVFICNMVKCRPPNNRAPAPDETEACWDYLVRQLSLIQPKVIVTLGNPSTKGLLNTKVGITRLRGQWQELPEIGPGLGGIPVMPTFHPAYVLRQYNADTRGKVWSDLQQVMELLGLSMPSR
jgi:uracil-DNA glycosylase